MDMVKNKEFEAVPEESLQNVSGGEGTDSVMIKTYMKCPKCKKYMYKVKINYRYRLKCISCGYMEGN